MTDGADDSASTTSSSDPDTADVRRWMPSPCRFPLVTCVLVEFARVLFGAIEARHFAVGIISAVVSPAATPPVFSGQCLAGRELDSAIPWSATGSPCGTASAAPQLAYRQK